MAVRKKKAPAEPVRIRIKKNDMVKVIAGTRQGQDRPRARGGPRDGHGSGGRRA